MSSQTAWPKLSGSLGSTDYIKALDNMAQQLRERGVNIIDRVQETVLVSHTYQIVAPETPDLVSYITSHLPALINIHNPRSEILASVLKNV